VALDRGGPAPAIRKSPRAEDGTPTIRGHRHGQLRRDELNYSSDIDLVFVYGDDGLTSVAKREAWRTATISPRGAHPRGGSRIRADEGYAFRVDLRLRPEGRMGGVVLSLAGYGVYLEERAELWERQALIKARFCAGDAGVAARFFDLVRPFVFRTGVDPDIVAAVRGMKAQIDKSLRVKGVQRRHVQAGRRRHPRDRIPRAGAPTPLLGR